MCMYLLAGVLFAGMSSLMIASPPPADQKDRAGEAAIALKEEAKKLLDPPPQVSLWADDGRVYQWSITLGGKTHMGAIIKAVGGSPDDPCTAIEKWCDQAVRQVVQMTVDAVKEKQLDPGFNPNTDIHVSFFVNNFPADAPCARQSSRPSFLPLAPAKPPTSYYSRTYVGLRRNPRHDDNGKAIEQIPVVPTGDQITVTIAPDRPVWKFRETITGKITISNTGKGRVPLSAWRVNSVDVHDPKGGDAPGFHVLGNIDPALDAPRHVYLDPGERHDGQFKVYTDRSYTMSNGHYLDPGSWRLSYPNVDGSVLGVVVTPVTVEVRATDGEYTGPRMCKVRGIGGNLLVGREHGVAELVDLADGHRVIAPRIYDYRIGGLFWSNLAYLAISSDRRLLAYAEDRTGPIKFEGLAKEAVVPGPVGIPQGLKLGQYGVRAVSFAPDDRSLICQTSDDCGQVAINGGALTRTLALAEKRMEFSPDGTFAAAIRGLRPRGSDRGEDMCELLIQGMNEGGQTTSIEIKGRGVAPDIAMGRTGVYLSDEFNSSALYVPYDGTPMRKLDIGDPGELVGESVDGKVCTFKVPRWREGQPLHDTLVVVFNVLDGSRLCTISGGEPMAVAMLESPLRIVCIPMKAANVDDTWGGMTWLTERGFVFDARTGERLKTVDLTPPAGTLPPLELGKRP